MQSILGTIVGGIIGIGLSILFVLPLFVMLLGSGVAVIGKIIDSILG